MKQQRLFWLLLLFTAVIVIFEGCKKDDPDPIEIPTEENSPYVLEHGILPPPPIPSDNPLTVEGVKLGRMLFYEPMLSGDNSMSCASCHKQTTAFSDTNTFSIGIEGLPGGRQAMPVVNMAWNTNEFFWDGRAHLLRDQSLKPIQDALEMNETLPNVIAKLQGSPMYVEQFRKAFGSDGIDTIRMSMAMEQFMNSIVSYKSKYDNYLAGIATLTEQEERGRFLFFTEYNPAFPDATGADCQHCHGGANFENDQYMNNGLEDDADFTDLGRENVTNNPADRAKFKVPSLRNVELTPPYMHDGRFNTLEEVVDHYNLVTMSSTLDGSFMQQLPAGLELTADDKAALVDFLKTLTDPTLATDPRFSDPF
jgi:cytochrome c peroxidase